MACVHAAPGPGDQTTTPAEDKAPVSAVGGDELAGVAGKRQEAMAPPSAEMHLTFVRSRKGPSAATPPWLRARSKTGNSPGGRAAAAANEPDRCRALDEERWTGERSRHSSAYWQVLSFGVAEERGPILARFHAIASMAIGAQSEHHVVK